MHKMEELKEMLCEELDKITKKGELSAGSLDVIDKLTHSIKSIATIIAMDEAQGYDGYSGARAGRRRDSMGRYSSRGDNMMGGSSYARRGYSRDDAMEELVEQLRDLEMNAKDEASRRMVQKWIKQAEG